MTVLLAAAAAGAAAAQPCDRSPLLVRGATVWTGSGPLIDRDVLVRDGRVVSIGPSGAVDHGAVRTLDGRGRTLLPGLVDSHLHFSIPGGLPKGAVPRTETEAITSRQLLRSGVTSGRLHLAALDEAVRLKALSTDPCQPMPRLQVGGPGLSGALEKDFAAFQGARTVDEGRAKVERFRAAGVDWVAVHDADRFAPGVLDAIASAARAVGLRVMAAGNTPAEIVAALGIRPDTLDYFDRSPAAQYDAAVLAAVRAQPDLILVPTPGVPYRTGEYMAHPEWLERAENFEFLEDSDRAFVLATARQDVTGPDSARWRDVLASLPVKFRQLRALGRPMALGSDAGSALQLQPNAVWWELEAWRAYGASHREALRAATAHGASVLRADDIGRLSVGSRADFVLYRGDVEEGPFDVNRVVAVGKDGVLFVDDGKWIGPPVPRPR